MSTLTQASFWFNFLYFFIVIFIAFYIPGNLLLNKIRLDKISKITLSLVLGYVLWGISGYILGFLSLIPLFYIYILTTTIAWLFLQKNNPGLSLKFNLKKYSSLDVLIILTVFAGFLTQIVTIFPNGIFDSKGLYFCCGAQDLIYHAALTGSIIKHFPPFEPGAAGLIVHNYHYFSNLVMAYLVSIFHLPLLATYFQYQGFLLSLAIGISALVFARSLKISKIYSFWLIFFIYFSGDLIHLFLFALGKGLNMHYVFLYDPSKIWSSPPRVAAIPVLFGGLALFNYWLKNKSLKTGVLSAIILSSLIAIKVYVGFFILVGLGFLELYFLLKKDYRSMVPWILTLVISVAFYLYVNRGAGGLVFVGTWRFENFISQPIFDLSRLELARQIYQNAHNILRILEYESIYALIYFVVLFGTLNLAFFQNKKSLSIFPKELNILLIPSLLITLGAGLFFIQKTGGANSAQFIITFEIFASIYAALSIFHFLYAKKSYFKILLIVLMIALSAPRVVSETISFLPVLKKGIGFHISYDEISALNYLKNNSNVNSLIMVDDNPYLKIFKNINGRRVEVPNYENRKFSQLLSYYVPLISQRNMFSDGGGVLYVFGIDIQDRIRDQDVVFQSKNPAEINKILSKDKINYIYTIPPRSKFLAKNKKLQKVFQNRSIVIFKALL